MNNHQQRTGKQPEGSKQMPFKITTAEMIETIVLGMMRSQSNTNSGKFGEATRDAETGEFFITLASGEQFQVRSIRAGWSVLNVRVGIDGIAANLLDACNYAVKPFDRN